MRIRKEFTRFLLELIIGCGIIIAISAGEPRELDTYVLGLFLGLFIGASYASMLLRIAVKRIKDLEFYILRNRYSDRELREMGVYDD